MSSGLQKRAVLAAQAALDDHEFVSAVDILVGMGWIHPVNVEAWRKGRLSCLEEMLPVGPEKVSQVLGIVREWALARGLTPIEAAYQAPARTERKLLQFTRSGDPAAEKAYYTHYVSPHISEKRTETIREKVSKPADLVVFSILKDSQCFQCKTELSTGDFLFMEGGQPLCLVCADLDHLVYLPSGDAALTRRSKKYSSLSAVVVRFSRARKRYERQGLLVEDAALDKAEDECLSDADLRERRRERDALRRIDEDVALVERMSGEIQKLFPGCPAKEARRIAAHTAVRGSGRVGRSASGRALEEDALTAAVVAHIRHEHTGYDELLMGGLDRASARAKVRERVEETLSSWREL